MPSWLCIMLVERVQAAAEMAGMIPALLRAATAARVLLIYMWGY
jgi:hypothetical protein